jgi:hypothetical protein
MNPPKADELDYIHFLIAAQKVFIALFVGRCREDIVLDSPVHLGDPALGDLLLEAVDRYRLRAAFRAW